MANQQITNLSDILFYSGEYAVEAAKATEGRQFGSYVTGLGYLEESASTRSMSWTSWPDVVFTESTPRFAYFSDIFRAAYSYAKANIEEYSVGTTYIANNRYNAIYTYEGDMENVFSNANACAKQDLKDFLLAINEQTFNKRKYYRDRPEVNSVKIGSITFDWYPENTVAYMDPYTVQQEAWSYTWGELEMDQESYNTAVAEYVEDPHTYYTNASGKYTQSLVTYAYSYIADVTMYRPYVIGGDYYSYTRSTYNTIDATLTKTIGDRLAEFEEAHGHEEDLYAYYMHECDADMLVTLSTLSCGTRKTTFKIGFDSIYDKWFTYAIGLHANVDEADKTIARITSSKNDTMFGIRLNENTETFGKNVKIDRLDTHEFKNAEPITADDEIRILTPDAIDTLDISPIKEALVGDVNLVESEWDKAKGYSMRNFIIGDGNDSTECHITKLTGLNAISTLEMVDIAGCSDLAQSPAIDKLSSLHVFDADRTKITTFKPAPGVQLYHVVLPDTIEAVKLVGAKFTPGTQVVADDTIRYNGEFIYEPTTKLTSLTLDDVEGIDTYEMTYKWWRLLDEANMVDSVIYLGLKGIAWTGVPVDFLNDLRKFDINHISGSASIIGTGTWGYITRDEYQSVLRTWGLDAFDPSNDFKISVERQAEDFEFHLSVASMDVTPVEEGSREFHVTEYDGKPVQLMEEEELTMSNYLTVTIENNRAGNAFLDLLNESTELKFTRDAHENYIMHDLEKPFDTADSEYIEVLEPGDIVLYNGNRVMVFYKKFLNPLYQYSRIGHIDDVTVTDLSLRDYSTVSELFNRDEVNMKFTLAERPTDVVNHIYAEASAMTIDINTPVEIAVSVDNADADITTHHAVYDERLFAVSFADGVYTVSMLEDTHADGTSSVRIVSDATDWVYADVKLSVYSIWAHTTTPEPTTTPAPEVTTTLAPVTLAPTTKEPYDASEDSTDYSDDYSDDFSDDEYDTTTPAPVTIAPTTAAPVTLAPTTESPYDDGSDDGSDDSSYDDVASQEKPGGDL